MPYLNNKSIRNIDRFRKENEVPNFLKKWFYEGCCLLEVEFSNSDCYKDLCHVYNLF